MTDIARRDQTPADIARLLGMNPSDPKTQAMVAVCARYELDPLLKHVVVIPGAGPYITRDGLLHVAHRSGQLDGIEIVSGPDLVDGEWRVVVSVYRKDMSRPFTFPGRYPANGGNRKYAPEMALKVAESMALRRAFDVSGLGIADERIEDEPQHQRPQSPRPVERLTAPDPDDPWAAQTPEVVEAEVVGEDDGASDGGEASGASSPLGEEGRSRPWINDPDGKPSQGQLGMLGVLLKGKSRDESLALVSGVIGREVESRNDLTKREMSAVIDHLKKAEAAS